MSPCGIVTEALKQLVLIVDDDPGIVDLISEQPVTSYRTRTASSGAEAIEQFIPERPAVVLLDLNMPRMNGLEAQQALRDIDSTVPVIQNGAFSYLPKPYHALYLQHLLAAALSQR